MSVRLFISVLLLMQLCIFLIVLTFSSLPPDGNLFLSSSPSSPPCLVICLFLLCPLLIIIIIVEIALYFLCARRNGREVTSRCIMAAKLLCFSLNVFSCIVKQSWAFCHTAHACWIKSECVCVCVCYVVCSKCVWRELWVGSRECV